MNGIQDYAGHPRRWRPPMGLIAALLFALLLIGAMVYSESELAVDYEMQRLARVEAEKLGLPPLDETAARPRKRKENNCFVERNPQALGAVTVIQQSRIT